MSVLKPADIKKVLVARSERVKCVEIHPKEPLVLASLYSGQVTLWNYETQTMLKSFEIVELPVRCVRFIVRLQSFACGSDDLFIRVFNYNTMEKIKTWEAHQDYIRSMAVHDTLPYLLTGSDDMTIKMWDWSKNWTLAMTFEGHAHYVMQVVFNPKDPSTFASASLDETAKVWNITCPQPNFTLEGHEQGVNCVEYYIGGEKPYLLTGSDDHTVKVWDYQTKQCITTLTHHVHNVPCVMFHPDLPLLVTASEDETIGIFSTQTWRQEQTLNYGMGRIWTLSSKAGTGKIAIGTDNGLVVIRVGREDPVVSMDPNGKILVAVNQEISKMDIKGIADKDVADGDIINLMGKEIGSTEAIPQSVSYGPSGQYIAVLVDGEYTINSALAWRPKTFGSAIAFVWGAENGSYAILENSTTLKIYKQFKLKDTHKLPYSAEGLFGGPLLSVKIDGAIVFYEWDSFNVARKVDVVVKNVTWSDSGELVALVTENGTYILKYNVDQVQEHFQSGATTTLDGLDFCFDVVEELEDKAKQATWVGDCLVYINTADKLNYYIGGEVTTIAVLPRNMFLLGFVAKESRVFCIDRDRNVVSYQLFVSVIEYKTAIVREDFETAELVLPKIPENMKLKVAQFLQARGENELALQVTTDDDHKFELAAGLGKLDVVLQLTKKAPSASRWKQVGELALEQAEFDLAEHALYEAGDFSGLLLLFTSTNAMGKISSLADAAWAKGKSNIAFTCYHLTGKYEDGVKVLRSTQRWAEACFYARTYCQDKVDDLVLHWRNSLSGLPRVRDAIADPKTYPNLFPQFQVKAPQHQPVTEEEEEEKKSASAHSSPECSHSHQAPEHSPVVHQDPNEQLSPPKSESASKLDSPPKEEESGETTTSATKSPPKKPEEDSPPKEAPTKEGKGEEDENFWDDMLEET